MCLQHNRVALTPRHFYRGKVKMSSFVFLFTFIWLHKTTEQLTAAMEAQQRFPFTLLSSSKLFLTAVKNVFLSF